MIGVGASKFHNWKQRYGKVNEHNAWVPRDGWLLEWEKQAILDFQREFPLEGYRRMAFMMLDRDIVAASPTTVYRVLKAAGRIGRFAGKLSQKGKGFSQPTRPHQHWHIDISFLNILGTFYSLCSIIDGYSRYIVHWEIRETMKERETEIIVERAREKLPGENPRIISDNGPQFIAKEFKEFIRLAERGRFAGQGSVVAGWRVYGGRRLGPYFRLAYREGTRQRSIYLGRCLELARGVRELLAELQRPRRERLWFTRLVAQVRASLRSAKAELERRLAVWGIRLEGFEFRGVRRALALGRNAGKPLHPRPNAGAKAGAPRAGVARSALGP